MRRFVVFDFDGSMAAIGGPEEQERVFGFPAKLIPTGGVDAVKALIGKMTEFKDKPASQAHASLFGEDTTSGEKVMALSENARNLGVTGVAIDTLSTMAFQTRMQVMRENKVKTMSLPLWGVYGDRMARFINALPKMDFPVIMTCHIDRDKDEQGGPIDMPAVKGGSKTDIPRFFDVIAYSRVSRDNDGNVKYSWQIRPDERHIYAKDRKGVMDATFIDPDLNAVLSAYEDAGLPNVKILILGDSGHGKTTSLATINPAST